MKKTMSLIITILVILALVVGCASQEVAEEIDEPETPAEAEKPVEKEQLKVGLLTSGDINDNGWNAMA